MIGHMRHMGNSGKFAVIAAVAALGMLVLTAITLEEAVMVTFLGLVALAYVAAVAEVLARGRHFVLVATAVGSSLTIAFSLAFVSTWELAFAEQSSIFGTPLPTGDPDNYFYWGGASAVATLAVLFLGAVWPAGRRLGTAKRGPSPAKRRRASGTGRTAARRPATGATAARGAAPRGAATGQRASGSRAPARMPASAAKRPSSSASPVRKPAPKPGTKTGAKPAPRR
ncbi:hypothetical protein ACVWY0_003086 [Arthrobacter sp. UYNi723]